MQRNVCIFFLEQCRAGCDKGECQYFKRSHGVMRENLGRLKTSLTAGFWISFRSEMVHRGRSSRSEVQQSSLRMMRDWTSIWVVLCVERNVFLILLMFQRRSLPEQVSVVRRVEKDSGLFMVTLNLCAVTDAEIWKASSEIMIWRWTAAQTHWSLNSDDDLLSVRWCHTVVDVEVRVRKRG